MKGRQKWLIAVLVVAIAATIGGLVYVASDPGAGERFTEFYLLGPKGQAGNYPSVIELGSSAHVTVGVVNHEGQEITYTVKVMIEEVILLEAGPATLSDDGTWEEEISFTPTQVGGRQKVEFLLYKGDPAGGASQTLYLWVDVVE